MYLLDPGRRDLLRPAVDAGVDTVITKAAAVTGELAGACARLGIRLLGSVACFSDHAEPAERRREDLRPVDQHGRVWEPMEWYHGIVPTDSDYVDDLVERCAALAGRPLDGLVLDFIRWPLHWELELRDGAVPRQSSFDARTLALFAARHPGAVAGRGPQWTGFRCEIITDVVRRISQRVRPGTWLGAFVVPAEGPRRRELTGQDIGRWRPWLDAVLPMTYHAILRQPPELIAARSREVTAAFGRPVTPMVQVTASHAVSRGYDWGPPITDTDFATAVQLAGESWCLFPGEGMDAGRWHVVSQNTDRTGKREAQG
ncbi:hypothetical protein ACTI_69560 [Actinoplanes sp. OR16]|nr:hypothetical protein ACTI_69560 [Actinoplanes sp. OR16]